MRRSTRTQYCVHVCKIYLVLCIIFHTTSLRRDNSTRLRIRNWPVVVLVSCEHVWIIDKCSEYKLRRKENFNIMFREWQIYLWLLCMVVADSANMKIAPVFVFYATLLAVVCFDCIAAQTASSNGTRKLQITENANPQGEKLSHIFYAVRLDNVESSMWQYSSGLVVPLVGWSWQTFVRLYWNWCKFYGLVKLKLSVWLRSSPLAWLELGNTRKSMSIVFKNQILIFRRV